MLRLNWVYFSNLHPFKELHLDTHPPNNPQWKQNNGDWFLDQKLYLPVVPNWDEKLKMEP